MGVRQYRNNAASVCVFFVKADWCPHCQRAKPEIRNAAEILGTVVPIYEVDSERDARTIQAWGIEGFPTILFRNARGAMIQYDGDRTGQAIADWVCSQSGMCGRRRA